ncbi:PIN domain-containing protein [Candidatus Daviesbacteria bacterium]|nr:PIN domain-containing protein [Candidatus Daviesbacteria bacterium]
MTNLKSSSKISLDTNILISALKRNHPKNEAARELIEQIKKIKPFVFISVLVIEEYLIHVYKQKQEKQIPNILNFITLEGLCSVIDVNRQIAMSAAKLRVMYLSLRTPDAIHLASAIESGAETFITTDRKIPRKIGKLTVKVLS